MTINKDKDPKAVHMVHVLYTVRDINIIREHLKDIEDILHAGSKDTNELEKAYLYAKEVNYLVYGVKTSLDILLEINDMGIEND